MSEPPSGEHWWTPAFEVFVETVPLAVREEIVGLLGCRVVEHLPLVSARSSRWFIRCPLVEWEVC
jgi:hypothetical protein